MTQLMKEKKSAGAKEKQTALLKHQTQNEAGKQFPKYHRQRNIEHNKIDIHVQKIQCTKAFLTRNN